MVMLLVTTVLAAGMMQERAVNPPAAAPADFSKRLQGYLTLRTDLARRLEPLAPTSDCPDRAALTTGPPLLLATLPQVPDNLPYRFFGQQVLVLDDDVEIVVDYVRNALPR